MKPGGVHQRRTRFIKEYLIDQNATRAAIAAGYSEKTAYSQGNRLLKNAEIKAEIAKFLTKTCDKLEISVEKVLEGLARLAFFDPRKFYNEDGTLKRVTELDEATAYALQGMDIEKLYEHFGKGAAKDVGTISKIKMADRGINLERLGRYFKLFTDKVEVSGMDALAESLAAARKRAS